MLNSDTIYVYDFSLAATSVQYKCRLNLLSVDEIARAERFKFDHHRRCWVSSRAALRTILARHAELAPEALCFTPLPNGKPFVHEKTNLEPTHSPKAEHVDSHPLLQFNLSHSHQRGLIAVSKHLELGCDVEHVKRVSDWPAVTRRFFSQAEQLELSEVELSQRPLAFFLGWTRKEALIKATGEGLRADLGAFDVTLTPGETAKVTAHRHPSQRHSNWHLRHYEWQSDYVSAVAVDSSTEPEFVFHQDCIPFD